MVMDYSQPPKMVHFNGANPLGWVQQVERFYFIYSISDSLKLPLASFYIDGYAREWFYSRYCNNHFRDWDHFVDELFDHFRNWTPPTSTIPDMSAPDTVDNTCNRDKCEITEDKVFDEIPQRDSSIVPSQTGPTDLLMVPSPNLVVLNDIVAMESEDSEGDISTNTENQVFIISSLPSETKLLDVQLTITPLECAFKVGKSNERRDVKARVQSLDDGVQQKQAASSLFKEATLIAQESVPYDISLVFQAFHYVDKWFDTGQGIKISFVYSGSSNFHNRVVANLVGAYALCPGDRTAVVPDEYDIRLDKMLAYQLFNKMSDRCCYSKVQVSLSENTYSFNIASHSRRTEYRSDTLVIDENIVTHKIEFLQLPFDPGEYVPPPISFELWPRTSDASHRSEGPLVIEEVVAIDIFGYNQTIWWVDTGQAEITLKPWDFACNIDTQFGEMDPAMSVVEKSSFAMASSKEDCVLVSQKLKEYSGMSFPFDPGATQLFVDGCIQPTAEFLPSFIYQIWMQLEAGHNAHIIGIYQLKVAPLMCAYLGVGNPIVQPTPKDLVFWQSKNNVASASFFVCINSDCLVTAGTFLKYYCSVVSLYVLLSVAISHVEYTLRDFLGAASYLEPWSLNVVGSALSLTDSTGINSLTLTLKGHIQYTPSNSMNRVWDPGLQWELLVDCLLLMVYLRQLSKELGKDVMLVLGLQFLQGILGSVDAIVKLVLFKRDCILQLESASSFVVYETMVYVLLENNIGILGQYKVCALHWTVLWEFPQDKKASKKSEETAIVWDPGSGNFVLSYLSIDQEINEVKNSARTTCFDGEDFNRRLVMYGLLLTYFMKLHQYDKADCALTEIYNKGLVTWEKLLHFAHFYLGLDIPMIYRAAHPWFLTVKQTMDQLLWCNASFPWLICKYDTYRSMVRFAWFNAPIVQFDLALEGAETDTLWLQRNFVCHNTWAIAIQLSKEDTKCMILSQDEVQAIEIIPRNSLAVMLRRALSFCSTLRYKKFNSNKYCHLYRAADFRTISYKARKNIAMLHWNFLVTSCTISLHGFLREVGQVLKLATPGRKLLSIFSFTRWSNRAALQLPSALVKFKVDIIFIGPAVGLLLECVVAYSMDEVKRIALGTYGVVEVRGLILMLGSCQVASVARNKHISTLCSYEYIHLYALTHNDLVSALCSYEFGIPIHLCVLMGSPGKCIIMEENFDGVYDSGNFRISAIGVERATISVLVSNLEDKVLIDGGSIVMNMDESDNVDGPIIWTMVALGLEDKLQSEQTTRWPINRMTWDPG